MITISISRLPITILPPHFKATSYIPPNPQVSHPFTSSLNIVDVIESTHRTVSSSQNKHSELTSVQITTYEHYIKLMENVGLKVRYEMDQSKRENGALKVKLIAVNTSNNQMRSVSFSEINTQNHGLEIAYNLFNQQRVLVHTDLNLKNFDRLSNFLNALRNIECL